MNMPEDDFMVCNKIVELMAEDRKTAAIGQISSDILKGKLRPVGEIIDQ